MYTWLDLYVIFLNLWDFPLPMFWINVYWNHVTNIIKSYSYTSFSRYKWQTMIVCVLSKALNLIKYAQILKCASGTLSGQIFAIFFLHSLVDCVNIVSDRYIIELMCKGRHGSGVNWLTHYKQGPKGQQNLTFLKSFNIKAPPPKNTRMCHETIRNGFLIKF